MPTRTFPSQLLPLLIPPSPFLFWNPFSSFLTYVAPWSSLTFPPGIRSLNSAYVPLLPASLLRFPHYKGGAAKVIVGSAGSLRGVATPFWGHAQVYGAEVTSCTVCQPKPILSCKVCVIKYLYRPGYPVLSREAHVVADILWWFLQILLKLEFVESFFIPERSATLFRLYRHIWNFEIFSFRDKVIRWIDRYKIHLRIYWVYGNLTFAYLCSPTIPAQKHE